MPKEEWGTKRICPTTGKRFYDLNKDPIVSPYTGEVITIDSGKTNRTMVADKPDRDAREDDLVDDDDVVLEDDDAGDDANGRCAQVADARGQRAQGLDDHL